MNIDRVIFNFNSLCPNKCGFCYTPFDNKGTGNLVLWEKIINRINTFSPKLLSFAGGDPFANLDFYSLITNLEKKCAINIDTCGLFLDKTKFSRICNKIDVIGIPIDDADNMEHRQRYTLNQCKKVLSNLECIRNYTENITIHTLLTSINQDYLVNIAQALMSNKIKTWNIYQFWPFDFIKDKQKYFISDNVFTKIGANINSLFGNMIDLKFKLYSQRKTGYFFVTSLGNVYTINPNNILEYVFIGSIFDSDICEKWSSICDLTNYTERLDNKISREF